MYVINVSLLRIQGPVTLNRHILKEIIVLALPIVIAFAQNASSRHLYDDEWHEEDVLTVINTDDDMQLERWYFKAQCELDPLARKYFQISYIERTMPALFRFLSLCNLLVKIRESMF